MSASSHLDLYIDQDRDDQTPNVENFEDGYFPALKPNYGLRVHTHHTSIDVIQRRPAYSNQCFCVQFCQSRENFFRILCIQLS